MMIDCEITNFDESKEDLFTYVSLFTDYGPIAFEDVVKETKWRKAMDVQIAYVKKKKKHMGVDRASKWAKKKKNLV